MTELPHQASTGLRLPTQMLLIIRFCRTATHTHPCVAHSPISREVVRSGRQKVSLDSLDDEVPGPDTTTIEHTTRWMLFMLVQYS